MNSSVSKVETDSQSDAVDRVVGLSPSSPSNESSTETDFIPEPRAQILNITAVKIWEKAGTSRESRTIRLVGHGSFLT